ncbi:MAG: hypothetical protein GXP54_02565, partial [Deltaproteobacteria bacterium]|nr:hypothetical protein [Deltaproteobacteria bacterium]
ALYLSRFAPWRMPLLAAWLMALPVSLLAVIMTGPGPGASLAAASLWASIAFRGGIAVTWSRRVLGPGPALAGFLTAPLRDILALALVCAASVGGYVRRDGRRFRMRKGGVLTPADEDEAG